MRSWSAEAPLPADFVARIAALRLPPISGADAAVQAWGSAEGNRVELRRSADGTSAVRIAVDTRRLDATFAAALLGLVRAVNGVLVRSDGRTLDGTVGAFSDALRSSSAWAHVNDPTGLLTGRRPRDEDAE